MSTPTDFRTTWLKTPVDKRHKLAEKMGTSYRYLQRISGGFAKPSLDFANRLDRTMRLMKLPPLDFKGFDRAAKSAGKRMHP